MKIKSLLKSPLTYISALVLLGAGELFDYGYNFDKKQELFNQIILDENNPSKAPVKSYLENTLNISFDKTNVQVNKVANYSSIFDITLSVGRYDTKTDDIYVNNEFFIFSDSSYSENEKSHHLNNTVQTTLAHEYGHDYTQQILNKLGLADEIPYENSPEKVVAEGIAECFLMSYEKAEHKPIAEDSLSKLVANMNIKPMYKYILGVELMHPILDTFGVDLGIKKVYTKLPSSRDLLTPSKYLESLRDVK